MQTKQSKIPGIVLNQIVPTSEPELLTGVPIFFGLAETDGNQPKKLTLSTQFDQYFSQVRGYLKEAIAGFFENGGELCYAIALADKTLESLQQALEDSEVVENADLVCVPDLMLASETELIQMQQAVLEHCERMGDRFAILDGLQDIQQLERQKQELSSPNGALYAPWFKVEHRSTYIPPCGHIAGIYAASDRISGVHNPPANITLAGVLDLSLIVTPAQQERLNPEHEPGINFIRSFRGRGIRVWGVRTLSPLSEWRYISVRRLFLTLRRWIDLKLGDLVFEPNAFPLWVRLQRELSVYCESLWRQGALVGNVPQEAFYIKCDGETNPPENREVGIVVAEIGLAPTIPGEFIRLSLVQSDSGVVLAQV